MFDTVTLAAAEIRYRGDQQQQQHKQHTVAARLVHGCRRQSTEQHGDDESCTDHGRPGIQAFWRGKRRIFFANKGSDEFDSVARSLGGRTGRRERQKTYVVVDWRSASRGARARGHMTSEEDGHAEGDGGVGVVMIWGSNSQ